MAATHRAPVSKASCTVSSLKVSRKPPRAEQEFEFRESDSVDKLHLSEVAALEWN